MLENYKIDTQGEVFIYALRGVKKILLGHIKNSLSADAKKVIANILAKVPGSSSLTDIGLFIGTDTPGTIVVRPIAYYNLIDVDRAQLDAIFEEDSFSGTIVASNISSPIGEFAKVTGLSLTKDPTDKILITWKIKII